MKVLPLAVFSAVLLAIVSFFAGALFHEKCGINPHQSCPCPVLKCPCKDCKCCPACPGASPVKKCGPKGCCGELEVK